MDAVKKIFASREHAKNYDEKAKKSNWRGSEVLMELANPYIKYGEKILDLGIGTGGTSVLFHEAGLRVYGMDFSAEMLNVCEAKNIAEELRVHDLSEQPYPYGSNSMDHAICGGVLHIFEDLKPIFDEVARILRTDGSFSFTCVDHNKAECEIQKDVNHKHMGKSITLYEHNKANIKKVLKSCGFTLLESSEFLVSLGGQNNSLRLFNAYVAQLN
jgi:ubiquinone/menaquinone biosynthesis C-methylase UbiE